MELEDAWSPEEQEKAVRLMKRLHELLDARQTGHNSSQEGIRQALVHCKYRHCKYRHCRYRYCKYRHC
jgi:hypothetical protein